MTLTLLVKRKRGFRRMASFHNAKRVRIAGRSLASPTTRCKPISRAPETWVGETPLKTPPQNRNRNRNRHQETRNGLALVNGSQQWILVPGVVRSRVTTTHLYPAPTDTPTYGILLKPLITNHRLYGWQLAILRDPVNPPHLHQTGWKPREFVATIICFLSCYLFTAGCAAIRRLSSHLVRLRILGGETTLHHPLLCLFGIQPVEAGPLLLWSLRKFLT
eukprot:Gregarina_sp_Poly_1__5142@NODE_2720_length_1788_cov_96_168507_g444_i2_p2_GENE_NODE_2720_length_1788_cov_96_168507_g444_i2NODE_2720_length_1788_cov_96_168507_g444_i2_p2_ORF_typecomplete_len219_score11_91MOSC/PF03473_17/0_078_NODE_2720_length_1788_cov_96_168507_g444_i26001256